MKSLNKRKGFTFMELVISVMIIGIIAVSLAVSLPAAFVTTRDTESISKATELASQYMETVKSNLSSESQYDLATAGTTPPLTVTAQYTGNSYYSVTTLITNLSTRSISGVQTVTLKEIDITYKKTGDTKVLANLSTILART